MDLRGPSPNFFVFFFTLLSFHLFAVAWASAQTGVGPALGAGVGTGMVVPDQEVTPKKLPITDIFDSAIEDIGTRRTVRPIETYLQEDLHTDTRNQLTDAFNTIPGVQARLQGSPMIEIRGSASSARTLVIEDGVPLNFSDGVGFNPLYIASENMGSVSFLKGPGSSLFGHDAVAGVTEFRTERLTTPKFFASQGSFNTNQTFAATPFSVAGAHAQVSAYETHSDGNFLYTDPQLNTAGSRTRNDQETLRATFEADGRLASGGGDGAGGLQFKTFNAIARQIGSTPDALTSNSPQAFNNWAELSGLTLQDKIDESWVLASRTAYKYFFQNYTNSEGTGGPNFTTSIRQGLSVTRKIQEAEIEVFDDFSDEQFHASYLASGAQNYTLNEAGLSAALPLNEEVWLQTVARFSSESGGFVPSIGLVGVSPQGWRYFASYAEGYRPASISQKYAVFQGFVPNPGLTSEHSVEIDLGFEKQVEKVFAHFELFSRSLQNLIQNNVIAVNTLTPQNVGQANAFGFEISGELKEPFHIKGSVDYLTNTEVDTNSPVPLSPSFQASMLVSHVLIARFTASLQDTYWGPYSDTSLVTGQLIGLGSWNTLDFFFDWALTEKLTAKLSLLNILDQPRQLTYGYPEPQRSLTFLMQEYL